MSYVIKKHDEINKEVCESTILLKRNINISHNLTKKMIRFTANFNYIFIQSGIISILYGISEYCGMNFIDFPSLSGVELVSCIEKIQNEIIEKYTDLFKGLIFSNNIQRNSIRFRYTAETKVFTEGGSIYRGKLTSGSRVKIIVCPREVWITGEKFGFNWDIIQLLLVETGDIRVEENLFGTLETPVSYGIYEKYIKMLKTGVPEGAIKLKMELDGVDSNVNLRQISKTGVTGVTSVTGVTTTSSGAPPPPPPPPILGGAVGSTRGSAGGGMAGVFANIRNGSGVKLKKVQAKDKRKIKREKTGLGGKISLQDILKARGTLNKTGSFL